MYEKRPNLKACWARLRKTGDPASVHNVKLRDATEEVTQWLAGVVERRGKLSVKLPRGYIVQRSHEGDLEFYNKRDRAISAWHLDELHEFAQDIAQGLADEICEAVGQPIPEQFQRGRSDDREVESDD